MNVKNNRRRQESREKIEKVFVELLQTRQISQISVSEICKLTGLNRSTFYANYEDIYALADSIREKLEGEVQALFDNNVSSKFNASDYLRLFYHIRDNQLFYKTYFKLGYDTQQFSLADLAEEYKIFPDEYMLYHIEFFRAGFNAIVKRWLQGGCRETPEEIGQVLKSEYSQRM